MPKVKDEEKHFCSECSKQIRKDSPDGLCKGCRPKAVPAKPGRKPRAAALLPSETPRADAYLERQKARRDIAAQREPAESEVREAMTLMFTSKQADCFFAALSLSDRCAILQGFVDQLSE